MTGITRLPASAETSEILDVIQADGALILADVLSRQQAEAVLTEVRPFMEATDNGADDFSGRLTTRTGGLVARSPSCRELILHPTILAATKSFLDPYCLRFQLHLGQIIRLRPGQPEQMIHRDRWAWGKYLKDVEPQFNTIWALSEFSADNGATRLVPGSIDWRDDRRAEMHEICQAIMDPGSVLLYTGSVFHGGGENRSDHDRIGLNITYSLGWLRQEENQYLSCPPEIARDLTPQMQDLLGYTQGSYALGYYTPPLPAGEGPGIVGPEYALGRTVEGDGLGSAELMEAVANT
jgi:ectoine hydroxylase-related dioxygenase (phytanoyl-CoA dioxygenase family)